MLDNLSLLLLFIGIFIVILLFIFVINIQKGYSVKMDNLPQSNTGRYGNKNALKNKEYYTDDSDDEDCIGYCKEEKIFIEMKERFEAKQTFDRVISSYGGVKVNCGLFPTDHDKTLDFEVLLKNFYKIKQKKQDCPELNFTKLVNHYVASWEKNPLGNATFDWVNQGTDLDSFFRSDFKHLGSKSKFVFRPGHPMKKSTYEEFMIYNKIVNKTINDCQPGNKCKLCNKSSSSPSSS